jgi:hypothetical protein
MQTDSEKAQDRATALLLEKNASLPVWIRPPVHGPDFWCGFGRGKLYQLAKDGHIKSVSIREPGTKHGTRLFNLRSILDYIERSAAKAEEVANGNAT